MTCSPNMTRMFLMHEALRRELEHAMLSSVPEPVRLPYDNEWRPTYAATDLFATRPRASAADGVAQ